MLEKNKVIDLVFAEKNPLLRTSLLDFFAKDERFHLIAMCEDGERFVEAVKRLSFDVGVIGWEMPFMDGRSVLQALKNNSSSPRIIIYTGSNNSDVPRLAMSLGAAGFCSKNDQVSALVDTIISVASGRMIFPFIDISQLSNDPFASLTVRERELLSSLADGLTNAQIGKKLDISLNTVKFHLKNLYDKLDVNNRAQAVANYLKRKK